MDAQPAIFPQRHAFLIGAQAYTDAGIRPLKTPTQDIRLMADALAAYGYQTHLCPDPTRETFVRFLDSIDTLAPGDDTQIVFYFAGHGVALTQHKADGPPNYGGYLLPIDAERSRLTETAIPMQTLTDRIGKLPGKQVLLILDCCYAGAIRQAAGFRGGIETDDDTVYQDDFGHYTRYRANQILTSSAHNQQALDQYVNAETAGENPTEATPHSPFATLLARALSQRDADTNRDGIVTVNELQQYVQQRLEAAAQAQDHEQTACLFQLASHEGGEFLFLEPTFNPTNLAQRVRVNPYKGLDAYQPEDSAFYYGRDAAIRDLQKKMETETFVLVVGASGTGKSSLVKAGVLGPCRKAGISYATIRPGKTPLAELDTIRQNPPRVLLLDQMEELITQAGDHSDEQMVQFFAALFAFQQSEAGRQTKVVATMRLEFVAQMNRQERFWNTDRQQYTIPVLDVEALQEIIIRPALQTGLFFYPEKETVARIIEDFRHYPNALPLLSLALTELYKIGDARPERTIYSRDYTGIGQILEQKEQTIMEPFRGHLDFYRDLLLRFVGFQGGEYARRRVENDELVFGPEQQPLCAQILKTLTENRLLTGRDASAGNGYHELTHEALIGSWRTYRQWIQQTGSAQLTLRDELAEAALHYTREGRKRAYVWGSVALLSLIRLGKPTDSGSSWRWNFSTFGSQFGHLSWLSVPERAFLARSFSVQRQNKLALVGVGLLLAMALGVGLFFQTRDAYGRLLSNARLAESQNAYSTAQQTYLTADTLARTSLLLRTGRRFLPFPPDSLRIRANLAGQRESLFDTLTRWLERADSLQNQTVQLLNERANTDGDGTGVAQACRGYRQFIRADSLYRSLENALRQTRTRTLLDGKTLTRFRDQAQAGYQVTGVMRANLLATCREVQEGYQLNGQTDLATQYSRYANALEGYARRVEVRR